MSDVRRHRRPRFLRVQRPRGPASAAIVGTVSQTEGLLQGLKLASRGWRPEMGSATRRNHMSGPGPLLAYVQAGSQAIYFPAVSRHKLPSAAIVHDGRKCPDSRIGRFSAGDSSTMSACLAVVPWPPAMSALVMLCFLKASPTTKVCGLQLIGPRRENQVRDPEDIVLDHVDEEKAVRVGFGIW
jgi:hypothetical protein